MDVIVIRKTNQFFSNMITQKRLKEILKYDKKTGIFIWKIFMSPKALKGQIAGTLNSLGYISIRIKGKGYLAHRLAWLYVKGYFPENEIDHKNRIKNKNKWKNLREASRSCNTRNVGLSIRNKSSIKGVFIIN